MVQPLWLFAHHHPALETRLPSEPTVTMDDPAAGVTLALVIPCFNEAVRLDPGAFARFAAERPDCALVFVDDGSVDDTGRVAGELAEGIGPRAAVHVLPHNVGKAEAVRLGVARALRMRPAFLGYWDADLATPLEEVDALLDALAEPGIHAATAARVQLLGRDIRRQTHRHYLGRGFATAASLVLHAPIYDTQCGAKLFRNTPEVRAAFAAPFLARWIFDVELLARLRRELGGDVAFRRAVVEVPVRRWHDVRGSKVRPRDFFHAGPELLRIWWRYVRPPLAPSAAGERA